HMTTRPSILIGLGTSGSEIVGRVYQKYHKLVERGEVEPNQCQFLAIDSDGGAVTINRYISALPPQSRLPMVNARAEGLREYKWQEDRFFRTWWYENFKNIGPAVNGCGTVPAKGRLVFWSELGITKPGSFKQAMEFAIQSAQTIHSYAETG